MQTKTPFSTIFFLFQFQPTLNQYGNLTSIPNLSAADTAIANHFLKPIGLPSPDNQLASGTTTLAQQISQNSIIPPPQPQQQQMNQLNQLNQVVSAANQVMQHLQQQQQQQQQVQQQQQNQLSQQQQQNLNGQGDLPGLGTQNGGGGQQHQF